MNRRRAELRPSGWVFPARTTAYLLVVAAVSMGALAYVGLQQIRTINEDNTDIRIDRAGRAATTLLEETRDGFVVERGDDGCPLTVTVDTVDRLVPGPEWDELLDTIGGVNEGAANVFRFDADTQRFDRISTTFRTPEGERVGGSQLEQGLIGEGHPAFANVTNGTPFVGEVPVAGRLRHAYLTPILDEEGNLAGMIAVDVGWADDLNRINGVSQDRALVSMLLLLLAMAVLGAIVMFLAFRPMHRLIKIAHDVGGHQRPDKIELTERRDEIGYLATGLSKVVDLQRTLEHRAYTDDLTAVPNRAAFVRELEARLDVVRANEGSSDDFALLIIDLDGFKEVNDGLGHQAGDDLLISLAASLCEALVPGEFLARLGGDEFAIISPIGPSGASAARAAGRRAMQAISGVRETSGGETNISTSVGIALVPEHGATPETVMSHADLALYAAKRAGRGRLHVYEAALSSPIRRRIHLATELRRAIGDDAIRLEYQPLFDTTDGRLRAVEGLARWNHPIDGPIPPIEFVRVAETSGLINEFGAHVIDSACTQIGRWHAAGLEVPTVAVNVSTMQLWNPEFVDAVRGCLAQHGVPRHGLCLELTESVIMQHEDGRHRELLDELRDIGVRLSIDDFGTGYSSLSYLRNLPVDQVKIDRLFIARATDDPKQAQLYAGIVALALNLDLEVVTEGVETTAELGLARRCGADLVQGFYLGASMPADEVEEWFGKIAAPWVPGTDAEEAVRV